MYYEQQHVEYLAINTLGYAWFMVGLYTTERIKILYGVEEKLSEKSFMLSMRLYK